MCLICFVVWPLTWFNLTKGKGGATIQKNLGSSLESCKTAKRLEVISADEVKLRAIN